MPAPKGHKPYLGCEKGGRPLKYTVKFIETEADAFELWMQREDSLWYKNFALARGYLPDQFSEWAKTTEKFSRVYRKSQEWQQSKLIKGGLLNKFNAGFTKFVMGNTCGWSDKQQISGEALTHYIQYVKSRPYAYGKHLVPHDAVVHEYSTGLSRVEVAKEHGINFTVVADIGMNEGIDAARNLLIRCWFDEEKCAKGVHALESYRKEWNDRHGCWSAIPCITSQAMEQMLLEC